MEVDHIAIAVKDIEKALEDFSILFGYQAFGPITINKRQKVKVAFARKENSIILKFIEPIDDSSPIYSFVKKGGGLHHICFKCKNLEESIRHLTLNKARVLVPPEPGEAFDNGLISFLFVGHGVNVEIVEDRFAPSHKK